jgi:hypothetical protein
MGRIAREQSVVPGDESIATIATTKTRRSR